MMRTFIIFVSLFICIEIPAQQTDLRLLSKQERNEYLLNLATEIVLNYGPDFYRPELPPKISGAKTYRELDANNDGLRKRLGQRYYLVTFSYDKKKELLHEDFAARIRIWENDGEPSLAEFGTGVGRHFFLKSYWQLKKEGIKPEDKVKYSQSKLKLYMAGRIKEDELY